MVGEHEAPTLGHETVVLSSPDLLHLPGALDDAGLVHAGHEGVLLPVRGPSNRANLDAAGHDAALVGYDNGTVLLITSSTDWVIEAAAAAGAPLGLSPMLTLPELAAGITAARQSLAQARQGTRETMAALAHYTRLVDALPASSLAPFIDDIIEPLDAYDAATGACLIESLTQFLAHDGSVQAAARTMHLHPNSLRHRLARVQEITGRNPLLFRDQVDLAIALRARARQAGLVES
jgi:sugar diacid utilization regulator